MSNRSLYKKTQTGWDRTQENEREREKRLYNQISQSPEPVKGKKRSAKKGKPRANHKHEYVDAILFESEKVTDLWLSRYKNKGFQPIADETSLDVRVGKVCSICGEEEKDRNWLSLFRAEFCADEPVVPLQKELPQFERAVGEKRFRRKANPIPLKRVFVGGSKTFSERSHLTFRELNAFCLANCEMLVSDMQGVGVAVREYLKRREYASVRVFPERKTDEAINCCDFGFAYLDGFTRDTTQEIERLLSQGKPCYVQMIEPISINKIFLSLDEWQAFVKAYKLQ